MSEAELAGALAMSEDDRKLTALLQIIGELETEAVDAAQTSVGNHGMCAGYITATEYMDRLRQRILVLREQGFGTLAKPS
jgi:hypothetical protein